MLKDGSRSDHFSNVGGDREEGESRFNSLLTRHFPAAYMSCCAMYMCAHTYKNVKNDPACDNTIYFLDCVLSTLNSHQHIALLLNSHLSSTLLFSPLPNPHLPLCPPPSPTAPLPFPISSHISLSSFPFVLLSSLSQPCYQKARQWLLDNILSVLVFGVCIGIVQVTTKY